MTPAPRPVQAWFPPLAVLALATTSLGGVLPGTPVVLARTGQAAQGAPGTTFGLFGPALLGDEGDLAFECELAGATVNGETRDGLWRGTASGYSLLARGGNPAPGAGPGFAYRPNITLLDVSGGDVHFTSVVLNPNPFTNAPATWRAGRNDPAPTLVARGGQIAPNGTRFGSIAPGLAAGPGNTVFMASTETSNALQSVFLASPSGIATLAEPRPVPGVPGASFKIVDRTNTRGNSSGLYAFRGNFEFVEGGAEHRGFWAGTSASPNLLGLVGGQVPGLAPGHTFITFDTSFMNDAGGMVFLALVRTPQGAQAGALVMGTASGIQAFTGPGLTPPPVSPAGGQTGSTIRDFNDRGELLVNGSSAQQPAYFVGSASGFRRVIVNGETPANAPGLRALVRNDSFGEYLLNNSGISVINAAMIGALNSNLGLLVQSPEFGLLVLAAPGDLFQVSPGDVRTIDRAILRDFNDRSEVLYVLRFTDQSEALVLNVVPAPGSAALLALGLAGAAVRRRRRPLGAGPG